MFLAIPTRADSYGTILDPDDIVYIAESMGTNDAFIWEFESNDSLIGSIVMNSAQFSDFINFIDFQWTAILCDGGFSDSGIWRPPYNDQWYILFINIGSYTTYLTIEVFLEIDYYSKDIPPISLIIGFVGFFTIIGIGGLIIAILKLKNKRSIENSN
ncbi:MAG: hypothetical protein ACFE9T_09575 [Promethearchaeota archaeon]